MSTPKPYPPEYYIDREDAIINRELLQKILRGALAEYNNCRMGEFRKIYGLSDAEFREFQKLAYRAEAAAKPPRRNI